MQIFSKVSNFLKVVFLFLFFLQLTNCAAFKSYDKPSQNQQPQTLEELINNRGSMTEALQSLKHTFSVELIKNGIISNDYVRISSLKLDNTPVITAVVSTNVSNATFVSILRNANTTPIGKILFAKNSGVTRGNMKIDVMTVNDIDNTIAKAYINKIGYDNKTHIVARSSQFLHDKEVLIVTEYVLPSMTKYFNK